MTSPSPLDLTTIAAVEGWLGTQSTASYQTLQSLITASSRLIYANLARSSLLPRTFIERYDGAAQRRMFLRNWPVLSISSLTVGNITIPAGTPPPNTTTPNGWLLDPWDGTPPGFP